MQLIFSVLDLEMKSAMLDYCRRHAFRQLGLAEPARDPAQFGLFGGGAEDES